MHTQKYSLSCPCGKEGFANLVAQAAVRALLCEVSITPKPGLVDRANSGAHTDMDFFTFINSSAALYPYFYDVSLSGYCFDGNAEELLPVIRPRGIQAEHEMLAATGGVNTHKGLIFSLGILCACVGYIEGHGQKATPQSLAQCAARVCTGICAELESHGQAATPQHPDAKQTYGQKAFSQNKAKGIRGEIEGGLPNVMRHGLPALNNSLGRGASLNTAGVTALLHLMANVDDTNIIGRAGAGALKEIKAQVSAFLAASPDASEDTILKYAQRLDNELTAKNISPGGSADLLAICLFMHFWFS